jgi:hypothetical protein
MATRNEEISILIGSRKIAISRCFRCSSTKLSAGGLSSLAETLDSCITQDRNNSETARSLRCFPMFL